MLFSEAVDLEAPVNEICDELRDEVIHENKILSSISQNVKDTNFISNLAVAISDFFCRNLMLPDADDKITDD